MSGSPPPAISPPAPIPIAPPVRHRYRRVAIVIGIIIVAFFVTSAIVYSDNQPEYLFNNETCNISGEGTGGGASCNGQFIGGSYVPVGTTAAFTIYVKFNLTSTAQFTIAYSASSQLTVELDGLASQVFNVNTATLQSSTYSVPAGQYELMITNYNSQDVSFTITAYVRP